jgi:c-di-GMP-binding flagellar brake protein YcgR
MIVLSEAKLELLFQEIAKGFVHSPLEIALFILLVLSILSIFLTVYRVQLHRIKEERAKRWMELYTHICSAKALNSSERLLLEQLSQYLKIAGEKNLLFENCSIFNFCVRKLQKDTHISSTVLSSLRCKLGFKRESPEQILHSSAELVTNVPVYISLADRVQSAGDCIQAGGIITKVNPDSISILVQKYHRLPEDGASLRVYVLKPSGVFSFQSRVLKRDGSTLHVNHSEHIKRLQRRTFYRKKLRLPVYVKIAGSEVRPVRTTLKDLGGGGASFISTGQGFLENDDITLFLFPPSSGRMVLSCKVVWVSEGGKTIHVAFGGIPESSRDRIIRYLFTSDFQAHGRATHGRAMKRLITQVNPVQRGEGSSKKPLHKNRASSFH